MSGEQKSLATTLVLDSNLENVDKGEELVVETARRMGFDDDALHEIGIATRESLVNAVAHGNRYNVRKKVTLRVEAFGDRIEIRIADEGGGFNPDKVPNPLEENNLLRESGRGLLMMRAFMDEFKVDCGDRTGTSVLMVKTLRPKE
jgi:serine/threonine-protein kinase RsbW